MQHRTEGITTVADAELPFVPGLAERTAEGRVIEEGIVAESVGAAGFVQDLAFHGTAERGFHFACFGECDDADEAGGPVRLSRQALQQQGVIFEVMSIRSRIAGRTDTGLSMKSVDFETGVVSEQRARGEAA